MAKPFFAAISTLIGTIIGAGILGIPYVAMRSGFGIAFLNIILIAFIITIIHLYLGEIGLRTKTNHHLSGYAELYLGRKGKILMFTAFAFGVYSALIAYMIGVGESLSFIFLKTTGYSLYFGIAFWILLSALSYFGLRALKEGEKLGAIIILILILLIIILFSREIDLSNLTYNNYSLFYLPFGVILFAFLGFAAIPEVERILSKNKHLTKKAIIASSMIVFVIYAIFTAIVLGSQGQNTPELATLSLGNIFVSLGILTMFTSHLALSTALVDTFHLDFKRSKISSWLLTILPPVIIFTLLNLINKASFIKVIGIGGVISGGLTGTLILLMVKNAKKLGKRKPEYKIPYIPILTWLIIIILTLGTILEILPLF